MKMSAALLRRALRDLDEATFARAVHGTARALLEELGAFSGRPDTGALRKLRAAGPVDIWTAPDALWTAASARRPHLHRYPLGECCERAFKRMLFDLVLPARGVVSVAADPEAAACKALRGAAAADDEDTLRRFLQNCFFEICIDRLRRPGPLARGYHLAKHRRMVSLHAESALRRTLGGQCGTLARRYLVLTRAAAGPAPLDDGMTGDTCHDLMGVRPRPSRSRLAHNRVNVVAGSSAKRLAHLPPGLRPAPRVTRLLMHDPRYNVSFSFKPFEEQLDGPLRSRVKDLLDLGVAVYMSDLYTRRERELDRRIRLAVSVRHPKEWSAAADEIRDTVARLGRDDFSVHFLKRRERPRDEPLDIRSDRRCVCLFSGGLDSAAGIAWALQEGLEPILVSHFAAPQLAGVQKELIKVFERRFDRELRHVSFFAAKRKDMGATQPAKRRSLDYLGAPPHSVMAQHLRSFLFLASAAAVALETGTSRVYMFENGPVAVNPLISEGRVNTQTAHPHVLDSFRSVIRRVFGVDLEIRNPFAYLTKGEVVRILVNGRLQSVVARTDSCWNWFNVALRARRLGLRWRHERHDGDCLPCVLRRVAVLAAGVSPERDARYLVDVFTTYPDLVPDVRLAIADLLRFCRNVLAFDDAALLRRVPELSVCVPGSDPRKLAAMLRRHAQEVRSAFRARANAAFHRDFAAVL